jgi:hypothetical protein
MCLQFIAQSLIPTVLNKHHSSSAEQHIKQFLSHFTLLRPHVVRWLVNRISHDLHSNINTLLHDNNDMMPLQLSTFRCEVRWIVASSKPLLRPLSNRNTDLVPLPLVRCSIKDSSGRVTFLDLTPGQVQVCTLL